MCPPGLRPELQSGPGDHIGSHLRGIRVRPCFSVLNLPFFVSSCLCAFVSALNLLLTLPLNYSDKKAHNKMDFPLRRGNLFCYALLNFRVRSRPGPRKATLLHEDRRPKTEDRRPKTEDRRPKTEDRRPKTEDRRPKTEVFDFQHFRFSFLLSWARSGAFLDFC